VNVGAGEDRLRVYAMLDVGKSNTFTVYGVCAYQVADTSEPTHVSLNAVGNVIGADDRPMSQAVAKLLQDEVNCQRGYRLPRSNVVSHHYGCCYVYPGATYPTAANTLGEYKLVKRAGCSAMYAYSLINGGVIPFDLKYTLSSTVEGNISITTLTGAAGNMGYWVGGKFTFSTANYPLEKELTLKLCSKLTTIVSGALSIVRGVCVTEKPPSASSVAHTVPDVSQYTMGEYLLSSQVENERTTLTHLWQHQPAIALSDWRSTTTGTLGQNYMSCNTAAFSKAHPTNAACVAAGPQVGSIIARALVFPSYGCSRIRITLGFQTYLGVNAPEENSSVKKYIEFQYSDSTVNATATWLGPCSYTNTSGVVQSTYFEGYCNVGSWLHSSQDGRSFRGSKWVEYSRNTYAVTALALRAETSMVSSARWLSPSSTITGASAVNPLQIWVASWSASTADYIMPKYVSIEEMPLTEDEFP
jgi:hypothetical protein